MAPIRIVIASFVLLGTAASPSAFATDMVSSPPTENVAAAGASPGPKKVRIIDMSAGSTVTSDDTKWYNRAPKPPIQKGAAKAETTHAEARAEKSKKKRFVQRAAPRQDAYSAYASEAARERQGFGLFNRR